MVAGKSVAIEWVKVDKYGRKIGKVLLAGEDANLVQIKRGLAWYYTQYQKEQSPILTNKAMQRLRTWLDRHRWAYGVMLTQFHPGSSGIKPSEL